MSILYPLSFFELFIINRKSVRFTAGIPDTSRIGTVGGEVANLGNDALRTDIDVLGVGRRKLTCESIFRHFTYLEILQIDLQIRLEHDSI